MKKRYRMIVIGAAAVVVCLTIASRIYYRGDAVSARETIDSATIANVLKGEYIPGTYSATEKGFGGDITVSITFGKDAMIDIQIDGENETRDIGESAILEMGPKVLAAQSAEVDAISGATVTSVAISAAVSHCIEQVRAK